MDDLRWILLLVGVVVVAAIYFSGRFESEDWVRERKQSAEGRRGKAGMRSKRSASKSATATMRTVVKKEPSMVVEKVESVAQKTQQSKSANSPVENAPAIEPEIAEPVTVTAAALDDDTSQVKTDAVIEQKPSEDSPQKNPDGQSSGIEDEITPIDIPADLAVAEAAIQVDDSEADETAELPPDIEPLVLSVSVLAEEGETFGGLDIKEALEAEGLEHGAMRIYHFHAPENQASANHDDVVFSVANLLEPGIFDLQKLDETHTPGLMFFCQLPGPVPGDTALEMMLDKGRGLAVRLHGHMCDDRRNRFTTQAKNHYLDRIAVFERELVLARSKTSMS